MKIEANGLQIEVDDAGGAGQPVLLLMGLGGQLIHWPDGFLHGLASAGFRAIRFDNRDAGLSQHLPGRGVPNLALAGARRLLGLPARPPYTLHDMAADALGVLDALGIARAHLVGISLGGMVAQRMAIAAPARCATLTSIMSSSGARGLPGPRAQVLKALARKPRAGAGADAVMRYHLDFFGAIAGPAFGMPDDQARALVRRTVARSHDPAANLRQRAAVMADTSRARALAQVRCPTLVLHGDADPFVPIECGRDTARRIAGARFVAIEGGGHDLAPRAFDAFLRQLLPFLQSHPIQPSATP
jgi:pimeloyl-ACP methyl ester carboxylesterase